MRSSARTMKNLTMQRRHFQAIAEVVAGLPTDSEVQVAYQKLVMERFANMLQYTNPNFDRATFYSACKPHEDTSDSDIIEGRWKPKLR